MDAKHINKSKLTLPEILAKIDAIYDEEEKINEMMSKGSVRLEQLKEDKEFLQNMYMYMSNRKERGM